MKFPLFQYLDQLFFNTGSPLVLSPRIYWRLYYSLHLERCFHTDWIVRSWNVSYKDFTRRYWFLVDRHFLEENSADFLEHCQQLNPIYYDSNYHPTERS